MIIQTSFNYAPCADPENFSVGGGGSEWYLSLPRGGGAGDRQPNPPTPTPDPRMTYLLAAFLTRGAVLTILAILRRTKVCVLDFPIFVKHFVVIFGIVVSIQIICNTFTSHVRWRKKCGLFTGEMEHGPASEFNMLYFLWLVKFETSNVNKW